MRERELAVASGFVAFSILFIVAVLLGLGLYWWHDSKPIAVTLIILGVIDLFLFAGLFIVNPNEAKVLQLFGKYVGTVRQAGWKWANPFYTRKKISVRIRNFESNKLKVNDNHGSPIEIAAVVVWRVVDTAEAAFEVDDYQNYVHVQTEAALRNLATQYPYDAHEEDVKSLRGNTPEIAEQLKREIQDRLSRAGVEVIEARITHLAYAPEIAAAMLRRQQAGAIIAARQRIVEGAVGMVDMALEMLKQKHVIEFDEDRKAAMVSNLLVVLCGEHAAEPVINTGTIYQ
ncbi:SPFH domain-containing protein [Fontivita pretiosa]|uniref:SPFH domain-containing protein n=1 Tax=Fontivita pretiosa TaxID=2989684 RepID=UPI003D178947